jgi:hypothetical protein
MVIGEVNQPHCGFRLGQGRNGGQEQHEQDKQQESFHRCLFI